MKRSGIFLLFFILAALALSYHYYTRLEPVLVIVRKADRGNVEKTVVNTRAGTVKPCRRAQLSPETGGRIARWPVRKGVMVKEGDLILELWNDDMQAAVTLAASEQEAAAARGEAACLQTEIAERDAKRYTELSRTGAAAKEKIDEVLSLAGVRRAECRSARAQLDVASSRLTLARAQLEKTRLRAPFPAVIAELNGELGEYVTPSPQGIKTLPIADLIDRSCYYVVAPIDEVDAPAVRAGMPVKITLDAFRGKVFPGKVRRVADYVLDLEKQARTVEIEAVFDDADQMDGLLAGFSADAEVLLESRPDVIRVPAEAVSKGERLYVFDPARQVVEERKVRLGLTNWQVAEIISGVREGELVVISVDRKGLVDGAPARIEDLGTRPQ